MNQRIEHSVKVSPCGRFKLDIRPCRSYNPEDQNAVWDENVHTLLDLETQKSIADYRYDHRDLSLFTFVELRGTTYLIMSEHYQGGYGIIDCSTGQKATWQPPAEQEDVWQWQSIESAEYDEDIEVYVFKVLGHRLDDTNIQVKTYIADGDPMKLPWRIPPNRSVDV